MTGGVREKHIPTLAYGINLPMPLLVACKIIASLFCKDNEPILSEKCSEKSVSRNEFWPQRPDLMGKFVVRFPFVANPFHKNTIVDFFTLHKLCKMNVDRSFQLRQEVAGYRAR